MTTITKNPNNSATIFVDDIISDMLRYLGNLSEFFLVMTKKNASDLSEVFARITPELELHSKRLIEYKRRREGQVKDKKELRISEEDGRFISALSGRGWFQKSYWGKSLGLRTVSRDEAIGIAIEAFMLGVVYIHHIPVGCPGGFRMWISGFGRFILAYLTEYIENQ